jgi:Uma2 family endonuclease
MAATTLLTSDQFLALPEEFDQYGNRIKDELIGGEIVRMPPASLLHDLVKNKIHELLSDFLHSNPQLGLRSLVEIGTQVTSIDTYIPDVSVVKRASLSIVARIFQGAPEISFEVVSPTDTAKHLKRKVHAYLKSGAKSVWVVYPESRSIEVYREGGMHEFIEDQSISDPFLPGFSSPVAAFFELI